MFGATLPLEIQQPVLVGWLVFEGCTAVRDRERSGGQTWAANEKCRARVFFTAGSVNSVRLAELK